MSTTDLSAVLPNQVIMWDPVHIAPEHEPGAGEWLRCLKATRPGDRQAVWEGRHGRGIVGVVDFGAHVRMERRGVYERWGAFTALTSPVSREQVFVNRVLAQRFGGNGAKALQGNAITLTPAEAHAINLLAGGLPPTAPPTDSPGPNEEVIDWTTGENHPPEVVIEEAAANKPNVWRWLGFREQPQQQVHVPGAGYADLLAPGTVGEAKRRVRADDGPAQLERYLDALTRQRPGDGPWRGVLLQCAEDLDEPTLERLRAMRYAVSVYSVWRERRWHVEQLFTKQAGRPRRSPRRRE